MLCHQETGPGQARFRRLVPSAGFETADSLVLSIIDCESTMLPPGCWLLSLGSTGHPHVEVEGPENLGCVAPSRLGRPFF